jgi:hypothetical protein
MPEMSEFLKKLEDTPNFEPTVLNVTEIHKVLIAICKLESIPADEEFDIRSRCQVLIAKWRKILGDNKAVEESDGAQKLTATTNAMP